MPDTVGPSWRSGLRQDKYAHGFIAADSGAGIRIARNARAFLSNARRSSLHEDGQDATASQHAAL